MQSSSSILMSPRVTLQKCIIHITPVTFFFCLIFFLHHTPLLCAGDPFRVRCTSSGVLWNAHPWAVRRSDQPLVRGSVQTLCINARAVFSGIFMQMRQRMCAGVRPFLSFQLSSCERGLLQRSKELLLEIHVTCCSITYAQYSDPSRQPKPSKCT